MAVRPNTGELFKGFTFDGVDSKDYGVYITQEAAYNAPERDVEMITIAGRNGEYALDHGRFLNVTVTYKAGITATDEASFADAIRALRNQLASRRGYCRLEDDYNTNEYRLAVFRGGLEVNAVDVLKAGEFTITFDCQPQRFLKSGENAVTVTSGDTITNPTLFDASPLLSVWGYGDINIGDSTITVPNSQLGTVVIGPSDEAQSPVTLTVSGSQLENGDTININSLRFTTIVGAPSGVSFNGTKTFTSSPYFTPQAELSSGGYWSVILGFGPQTFTKGTASNKNTSFTATYGLSNSTNNTVDYAVTYSYDGDSEFTFSVTITPSGTQYTSVACSWSEVIGNSTQSSLGNPLYIDLEIGEAYKIENDVLISVNNSISIPAKLPKLKSGANVITYDNTMTSFVITPRWWEV